jgi:peptidoglycan/LPS O-acetylase OafA/YrhL
MGSLEYRPAIDGLRAVAILSVFVFHLNHHWLPGGFLGVDVFFVISGYLITSIIFKECKDGSFSLKRFYQRRIARIFPAFFTVALATLICARWIYSAQDFASTGANLSAAALSVANLKLMLQGNYFEVSADAQPFLHYWSLSVEEQFYLLFPLLFLLVFKYARKQNALLLGGLCFGSFAVSLLMFRWKPVWAFYLLPARAWELLAGCLLAVLSGRRSPGPDDSWRRWTSALGLGMIAFSVVLGGEGRAVPAYASLLAVLGAVGVLMPLVGSRGIAEKWLAATPLVLVGRISYSLYLWHWPVFSLVDYKMYLASGSTRLGMKVALSLLAAATSFWLLEKPARLFLNQRRSVALAYSSMVCAIIVSVVLGVGIRKAQYVNAELRDVAKGGLVFGSTTNANSVVLMGDSNGSMYGKVLREICVELGYRLTVISVAADDPLPNSNALQGPLWLDSLAVVRRERPTCLVLACAWGSKLDDHKERLALAVEALKPHVGRLLILNQPPVLPMNANRAAIRQGARPPFYEDGILRRKRVESNDYLDRFNFGNSCVIDIASHFETSNGEVLFLDGKGRQLYQDPTHLSGVGAELVRPVLSEALSQGSKTRAQL